MARGNAQKRFAARSLLSYHDERAQTRDLPTNEKPSR